MTICMRPVSHITVSYRKPLLNKGRDSCYTRRQKPTTRRTGCFQTNTNNNAFFETEERTVSKSSSIKHELHCQKAPSYKMDYHKTDMSLKYSSVTKDRNDGKPQFCDETVTS